MSDVYVDNIRPRDADNISIHGSLSANQKPVLPGITFADGTSLATASPVTSQQLFTSSGTWTKPDGVSVIQIMVVGGGGGSAGTSQNQQGKGTGGDGAAVTDWIDVSLVTSVAVTVGAAGTAAGTSGGNGNAGGNSVFGSYITAGGGAGGIQSQAAEASDGSVTASQGTALINTGTFGNPIYGIGGVNTDNGTTGGVVGTVGVVYVRVIG